MLFSYILILLVWMDSNHHFNRDQCFRSIVLDPRRPIVLQHQFGRPDRTRTCEPRREGIYSPPTLPLCYWPKFCWIFPALTTFLINNAWKNQHCDLGENRTLTSLRTSDFESDASTNSATRPNLINWIPNQYLYPKRITPFLSMRPSRQLDHYDCDQRGTRTLMPS